MNYDDLQDGYVGAGIWRIGQPNTLLPLEDSLKKMWGDPWLQEKARKLKPKKQKKEPQPWSINEQQVGM